MILVQSSASVIESHLFHSPASSCTDFRPPVRERAMLPLLRWEASQEFSWAAVLQRDRVSEVQL
jgi:hypothetical protein